MKAGRHTDYSQEILDKTKEYLEKYEELKEVIPTVAGLASYLKIARSTIYEWIGQEDKQAFSDILEGILSEQEKTLINKGLRGVFNSTITKMMMTKHGYRDESKTDISSNGEPIKTINYIIPNGDKSSTN